VYGVCLKYLEDRDAAKDAVMQIFEKLLNQLPGPEIINFKTWLFVVTKNHCLMAIRSDKGIRERALEYNNNALVFMETAASLHPDNAAIDDKNLDALKKCIDELKSEQQACVALFYLQEKCYKEIIDLLKMDMKKVKSHIQNGKRNLKICMEKRA
jgi:RNA polymerase sigma-70 factor (ECF subfamily)